MKANTLITIVVTVHNSEKYLEECLNSVCNQTYKNIEILCIDGGSKDASPEILQNYARQYPQIRIINDLNTSYGHKVNRGFAEAKGEYVGILESDDTYYLDMIERLEQIIVKYHPDVVSGNIHTFMSYKGRKIGKQIHKYGNNDYYGRLTHKEEGICYAHGAIYTALYRKQFLLDNNIKLNETPGAAFQDQGFSFLTDILAETKYNIDEPVYNYRIDNIGSSMHDDRKILENSWEMDYIEKELRIRDIQDKDIWNRFYMHKYSIYLSLMRRFSEEAKEVFAPVFWKALVKDVKEGLFDRKIFTSKQLEDLNSFYSNQNYFMKFEQMKEEALYSVAIHLLDYLQDDGVVVFGASVVGQDLAEILCEDNKIVYCFCDNSERLIGKQFHNIEVLRVYDAVEKYRDAVFVITSKLYSKKMKRQILELGISEGMVYDVWHNTL